MKNALITFLITGACLIICVACNRSEKTQSTPSVDEQADTVMPATENQIIDYDTCYSDTKSLWEAYEKADVFYHTIKAGQTLYGIAGLYTGNEKDEVLIQYLNKDVDPEHLVPGTIIRVK
jgi:hypothetical protein